jgi:2-C-methyl-D-erythritol 4-phosphate cytidylyltransferase / 2-C-methyl-D-erythritol 2,4-cyclodiphosphate synthase
MEINTWGAVIVAAGSGSRYGAGVPKQFLRLKGRALIDWSVDAFKGVEGIGEIVVVTPPESSLWEPYWTPQPGVRVVAGGRRRQDSVIAGLKALESSRFVLIHDAARPLVSDSLIRRIMNAAMVSGAAVPVIPVRDTVKRLTSSSTVSGTVPRENLRFSQTPQGFGVQAILGALGRTGDVTDECEAMELSGHGVSIVEGDPVNIKLTDPGDLAVIEALIGDAMEERTGIGLDFHPFRRGIPLVVGGLPIDEEFGLDGHSDGDAVLHAIADALLSAARLGDIGTLFPPEDVRWKDADSSILLERVCSLASEDGWKIDQLDITVISEIPRIKPLREKMIDRIAAITSADPSRVWVKGTTTNSLGDIGKSRGLGCMVMARISRRKGKA